MNRDFRNDWLAQLFRCADEDTAALVAPQPYFVLRRNGAAVELAREIAVTVPLHKVLCTVNGTVPDAEIAPVLDLLPTLPRNVGLAAVLYRFERVRIRALYDAGVRHFVGQTGGMEGFPALQRGSGVAGAYFSDELLRHWIESDRDAGRIRTTFRLTDRELEVAKMMARRMSNKEIAATLGVSVRTIETHRLNIRRKLGANGFENGSGVPELLG
jgi:DNA-binding CsgD family transcriptional regulator